MADALALAWRQYRLERRMFWRNPTAANTTSSPGCSGQPIPKSSRPATTTMTSWTAAFVTALPSSPPR